jgi:YesN/AraC family two-component response regulator
MEDYYLIQMLSGIKDKDSPPIYAQFPFLNFCCAIIYLDYYNTIAENQTEEYIEDAKMNILKICRKKLTPFVHCSGIFMEPNSIVLILNSNSSDLNFLPGILKEIQEEILSLFTYSISIGVGKICSQSEVHLAYSTARMALARRLILGPGSLIQYHQEEAAKGYFYPYDKEEIIFNRLRSHSNEAIAEDTKEFFRTIKDQKDISVDNVIQVCNQLLGGIIKYLVVLGISSREIFNDESNLYLVLSRFEFLEETEKFFAELLKKIIQMESIMGIQRESPIDRIMHYIRSNYDKPFDLNKLADEVNLSYSHVRRVFSAEMNESILNYVYKMKVQFSKKLLQETEMSVNEISEKLGFYNKQSFYRFFKKFEGITPNKYRGIAE